MTVARVEDIDIGPQRLLLGRTVHDEDVATAAPMRAMKVTFDRLEKAPAPGEPIPPGWHVAYFLPTLPLSAMGADGMPLDNGVLPEMPLPRRMHAGNCLTFHSPILVGDTLRRESEFSDIQLRQGRSGPLIFTAQTRRIYTSRGLAITEENTSVFLPAESGADKKGPSQADAAPSDAPFSRLITPDPVSLFRYSALTFNAHRIHYDRTHAIQQEGFPGVVVQGMFTGQCLIDFARDSLPGVQFTRFSFRATAPLFDTSPCRLLGRPTPGKNQVDLWAVTPEGATAMKATMAYVKESGG